VCCSSAFTPLLSRKNPTSFSHNTTRMHIWTHLQPKYEAMVADLGLYGAGMQELDENVGVLLKKLDDLSL
jgi:arylsulfatase A-like enzyme